MAATNASDEKMPASKTGRFAATPLDVPALGWRQILVRAWRRSFDNNIGLVAAGTAFYGFISLVPILIACVLVYSLVADPLGVVRSVRALGLIMPDEGARQVGEQLLRVVNSSGRVKGIGLVVSLAVALFGARNASSALIAALNIAYGEDERRSFQRLSLVALAITLSGFALAFLMLIAIAMLGAAQSLVPHASFGALFVIRIVAYSIILAIAAGGAATLYRHAPCRSKARWSWITPGSLFAATAWLLLTFAFGFYVENFGTYATNYGPSAAGMVMLVWLYLTGVVFLFGAEINAELEQQTEKDTTEGPDRPIGQRGAAAADEVAAGS